MTILTQIQNNARTDYDASLVYFNGGWWDGGVRLPSDALVIGGHEWAPQPIVGYDCAIRIGGGRICKYVVGGVRGGRFGRERARVRISCFTRSSGQRMSRYLREADSNYRSMLTLTYPSGEGYGYDPVRCKRDLKVFLQSLKRYCSENTNYSAFWFAEFQENRSLHFHIYCTNFIKTTWLSRTWGRIVGSGLEKHSKVGTRVNGIYSGRYGQISYARKYARKEQQKTLPDGVEGIGRWWGVDGKSTVSAATIKCDNLGAKSMRSLEKLKELSEKIEKGEVKGKVGYHKVMVDAKGSEKGSRDKDIGCSIWDIRDPALINEVNKLVKEIIEEGHGHMHGDMFGLHEGWECQRNASTSRTGRG